MATLINIYGTARSGSTMLDLMLGNAANAFSCGEVSAWFRPYRKHHFKLNCNCGQDPCPVWEKIKSVPENQFHAKVINCLQIDYVIDSSKDICWLIDAQNWAGLNGIRSVNLVLWKYPEDLAYSNWKRGSGIYYWRKEFLNCYTKILEAGLPYAAINYSDLVNNPRLILSQICNVTGLTYFEGKERFWEKEHHYLFGSAGINKQVKRKDSIIYKKEPYSTEFENQIEALQKSINSDTMVQNILQILKKADISSEHKHENPVSSRHTYPIWYYKKKLIRSLRRYFPEHYDTSVV